MRNERSVPPFQSRWCARKLLHLASSPAKFTDDASSAAPPPFLGPIRGHRWPGFLCHAFGTWNGHNFFVLQSPQTCDGSIPAYSFMRFGCNACFAAWAQFLRSDFRATGPLSAMKDPQNIQMVKLLSLRLGTPFMISLRPRTLPFDCSFFRPAAPFLKKLAGPGPCPCLDRLEPRPNVGEKILMLASVVFTSPQCCSVVSVNTSNSVQSPTLASSSQEQDEIKAGVGVEI